MVGRLRGGSSRPKPPAGAWLLALLLVQHGRVLASAEHMFSVSCAAGRLNRKVAQSLRVRTNFRGDLHSRSEVATRRIVSLLHRAATVPPHAVIRTLR